MSLEDLTQRKEGKKSECGPVLTTFACAYGQLQEIQSDPTDNKNNKLRGNIVQCLSTWAFKERLHRTTQTEKENNRFCHDSRK